MALTTKKNKKQQFTFPNKITTTTASITSPTRENKKQNCKISDRLSMPKNHNGQLNLQLLLF